MDDLLSNERDGGSIAVVPIGAERLEEWRASAPPEASTWVGRTGFPARPGSTCLVPGPGGRLACVLAGIDRHDDPWALAHVPEAIPAGAYHLDPGWSSQQIEGAALGWALAAYRFERYKKSSAPSASIIDDARVEALEAALDALNADLPPLKEFILPGGGAGACATHVARAVCRRAERGLVALAADEPVNEASRRYVNRLSDYLFVAARVLARAGSGEVCWKHERSRGAG